MKELKNKNIWVFDDDPAILLSLDLVLSDYFGEVRTWSKLDNLQTALDTQEPNILLMDMNYSIGAVDGQEGLLLLDHLKQHHPTIPVVAMTAYGDVNLAVSAMKAGASDFVDKPWGNERLVVTLANVLRLSESEQQLERWKNQSVQDLKPSMHEHLGMVGSSQAIENVRKKIRKIANSDANIIVLGENGTGKELVAQALHLLSERSRQPFGKIDLGTIPETLFDSEMFGAKKGSYTGIEEDKVGRIALANKGTLFLDEIGNLPFSIQGKLLSFLQNREIIPLGSGVAQSVDVRLISATNLELDHLTDSSQFRQDLLYRLNTVEIHLPPLRDRSEDIPELIDHFLSVFKLKYNRPELKVSSNLYTDAMTYIWPGNVRELEHAVERAVLLSNGRMVKAIDLGLSTQKNNAPQSIGLNIANTEESLVRKALKKHEGSITKASKELGITRSSLYRRMEKYNV